MLTQHICISNEVNYSAKERPMAITKEHFKIVFRENQNYELRYIFIAICNQLFNNTSDHCNLCNLTEFLTSFILLWPGDTEWYVITLSSWVLSAAHCLKGTKPLSGHIHTTYPMYDLKYWIWVSILRSWQSLVVRCHHNPSTELLVVFLFRRGFSHAVFSRCEFQLAVIS